MKAKDSEHRKPECLESRRELEGDREAQREVQRHRGTYGLKKQDKIGGKTIGREKDFGRGW